LPGARFVDSIDALEADRPFLLEIALANRGIDNLAVLARHKARDVIAAKAATG
jgi:hypothetical protein